MARPTGDPVLDRRTLLGLAALAPLGALTGCGAGGRVVTADVARRPADGAPVPATVAAVGAFSTDLLAAVATGGNVVCSPYSVLVALAMVRNGATGETAEQLDAVLHLPDLAVLDAGLNSLDQALATRAGRRRTADRTSATVALDVANRVWGQQGDVWEPAFLEALASSYGTGVATADIGGDPEAARREVNAWVAERTHDTIPELVPVGSVTADTRLVLVNALHARAPWHERLHPDPSLPFRAPGGPVPVPAVAGTLERAGLVGDGWTAARVPLAGQELALTLVLPDDDLTALHRQLRGDGLVRLLARTPDRTVSLRMPALSLRTELDLVGVLSALGMLRVFAAGLAELDGMTRTEPLFLSHVQHQGWLALDEHGLEASAATGVVADAVSAVLADLELTLDRPYLACLHDVATALPLLLVQVTDPSERAS